MKQKNGAKAIKISAEAYDVLSNLSKETMMPISCVASLIIVHRDKKMKVSDGNTVTLKNVDFL